MTLHLPQPNLGDSSGQHDTLVWVASNAQPSRIGFYSASNRLLTASAPVGLPRFMYGPRPIPVAQWTYGHWIYKGMSPTLEVNGRERDDWANQRELFLSSDAKQARIPMLDAHHDDSILTFFGQWQVHSLMCTGNRPVGTATNVGVALNKNSTGRTDLLLFNAVRGAGGAAMRLRTDTVRADTTYDKVMYVMQRMPGLYTETHDWYGPMGLASFALVARSAARDSVLLVIDTMTAKWTDFAWRADTGVVDLGSLRDSLIYFELTAQVSNITDVAASPMLVVEEAAISDSGSTDTFGKQAMRSAGRFGMVPESSMRNPLRLTCAPNPFNPYTAIGFDVPREDADDDVGVYVYSMMGTTMSVLANGPRAQGHYQLQLNASGWPNGSYILAVHTRTHQQSKQIILTR
jgi:hypothetical protein